VGNAAVDGAAAVALNPGILSLAESAAKGATHVELALDPGFTAALMKATAFERYRG
jgi:hypothetical protein